MTKTPKKTTKSAAATKPARPNKKPAAKAANEKIVPPHNVAANIANKPSPITSEKAAPSQTATSTTTGGSELPAPSRRRAGPAAGAILTLFVLGAAGIGGAATWQYWWPHVEPMLPRSAPLNDVRVNGLQTQLDTLEARMLNPESGTVQNAGALADLEQEREQLRVELSGVMERLARAEQALRDIEAATLAMSPSTEGGPEAANALLGGLNERISALEDSPNIGELRSRLNAMEEQAQISEQARKQDVATLAEVRQRVGSLETREVSIVSGSNVNASALVLSIAQLRTAVQSGKAYSNELAAVVASLTNETDPVALEALNALRDYEGNGVPTLNALRNAFDVALPSVMQADVQASDEGWLGAITNQLSGLVTVRRLDDAASPGSVDARLSQAEAAMDAGDLGGVLGALEGLEGAPATALAPWLDRARARFAVEQALHGLHNIAITRLTTAQD